MWFRTAEITTTSEGVEIRDAPSSGPDCRLRAALLRWDAPGGAPPGAAVAGAAWEGPGGAVYWGWPDKAGQIQLRPGPGDPEVCSLLPPALSMALAFRRSGADLGVRAHVIGGGFLSRLAGAVALAVGCRLRLETGRNKEETARTSLWDLVIETTGDPGELDRAVALCRDWGTILSLGGGLMSGPMNYYAHVHRRALNLTHVPDRPVLCPGDEEIAERGAPVLAAALRGIAPAREEESRARVLPEGRSARLVRERSGWGLLTVGGSGTPQPVKRDQA